MKLKSIVMLLSLVTTMMAFNAAGGSDAEFATTNTALILYIVINQAFHLVLA